MFLRILSFPDLEKGMASGSWKSEAEEAGGVAVNSWVQLGQTTLRPTSSRETEQLAVQDGQSYRRTSVIQGKMSGLRGLLPEDP